MAFTEVEDPSRARRRRSGRLLGILGLILLFGSGLSIRFVPTGLELYLIAMMVIAVAILIVSYLLVR
ncbi:MAG: hypothetical protein LN412_00450 [Candidatus Thermoplasmatota archaeon]|nr:hypothetical protein [Candidatus Thermoplasmatota archaeon]